MAEIKRGRFDRPRILSEDREDDERKRIEFHTVEVCQWLRELFGIEINQDDFMDKLKTGVEICRLQNKLTATLGGEKIEYHADAKEYSQFARENVDYFINYCEVLGLRPHQRFESNDIVNRRSEQRAINEQRCKRVVLCLRQIKQIYETALRNKKEATVSEGEEDGRGEGELDSSDLTSKTQETSEPDLHVSDSTGQPSDLPPVQEDDNEANDEDGLMDENEPNEQRGDDKPEEEGYLHVGSPTTVLGHPQTPIPHPVPNPAPIPITNRGTSQDTPGHLMAIPIPSYVYPTLVLCIAPLVLLGALYLLKRRK